MRATTRPAYGVPWYIHPVQGAAWSQLIAGDLGIGFAVVNVDSGPGKQLDRSYREALACVSAASPRLFGYVDVSYGQRPSADVRADARLWRERYGVSSVMLDCVPAQAGVGHWSFSLLEQLREEGAELVATNPGVPPDPELLWAADITCVCECDYSHYLALPEGPKQHCFPAARVWHLIHGCPETSLADVVDLARRRGAGHVWATPGTLPDPWSQLPAWARRGDP